MARAGWRGAGRLLLGGLLLAWACGGGHGEDVLPPFWVWGGVVAGDLDGDGRADVAVAATRIADGRHENQLQVRLQRPGGGFAGPDVHPVGPQPWGLWRGDLDGDGLPELVAAVPSTASPQPGAVEDSGGLLVLRQDPARPGAFLPPVAVRTGGAAEAVVGLTLDGASLPALAVADGVNRDSRALLLRPDPAAPGAYLPPETLAAGTGQGFVGLAAADVDGDGLADLVLAGGPGLALFLQQPGGTFAAPILLPVGTATQAVAVADLDGDGRMDLAAVCAGDPYDLRSGGAQVAVFRQTAPGVFTAAAQPVAASARQIAIGDLDGDGRPDLVVLSLVLQALDTPSRITVLRQSGTAPGAFTVARVQDGTLNAGFLALADLDGDGRLDLLLNEGPSQMLQTAPGAFAAPEPLR